MGVVACKGELYALGVVACNGAVACKEGCVKSEEGQSEALDDEAEPVFDDCKFDGSLQDPSPTKFCSTTDVPIFLQPSASRINKLFRRLTMQALELHGGKNDVTAEQVQLHEYQAWKCPESDKNWENFKINRPYSVKGYVSKAPKAGDAAPDGVVLNLSSVSFNSTLLEEVMKLSQEKSKRFVAVSFGSHSCPIYRSFAARDLHKAVVSKGFPVLHVYTREANAFDEYRSLANEQGLVGLKTQVLTHFNEEERRHAAVMHHAHLEKIYGESVTMVIDGMDDKLEKCYEARPFRLYIIEAQTQKVVYASGPGPYNLPAKYKGIKDCLDKDTAKYFFASPAMLQRKNECSVKIPRKLLQRSQSSVG